MVYIPYMTVLYMVYNPQQTCEAGAQRVCTTDNIYATHGLETIPYIMCYGETILVIQCHGGVVKD